jgi:hypothetical protein
MIKKRNTLLLWLIIFGLISLFVPVVSAATENIDFGVTKTSSIDIAGEVDTYTFSGNTGDGIDIRITKTSGNLYPRITLFGPSGKEIKREYGPSTAEILYILTESGSYKILADNGISTAYTGDYSVFVQKVNNPKNTKPVVFSNTATGSLDIPGSIDTYSFTGRNSDEVVIRITKTSGNLYPRITLFGPTGKEIKREYGPSTAEITYTLLTSGTHTILVDNGISTAYTGDYSLFAGITSGNQGTSDGNLISPSMTTTASSVVKPTSELPKDAQPDSQGGVFPANYLVYIIITIVLICVLAISYGKWVKKPKIAEGATPGIHIPPTYQGRVSGTINHDVIISYSSLDKPTADAICAGLEMRGIRCWIAPRDILPGVNYQEAIIDAITSSKIMVLIYSSHANESPHVIREATIAMSKKVIIIPFRLDNSPLSQTMEFIISVPHWLEAITPPLENHIRELADTIMILLENERKKQKN